MAYDEMQWARALNYHSQSVEDAVELFKWLRRASYTPFVVYRVILGAALLCWVYGLFASVPWIPPPPA